MDYVNNFLNIYYSKDIDVIIYKSFITYVFKEIAERMNTTTNINDIIKAFQRIGINNDINELLNNMVNYAKMENLSRIIRENLNHEPLILILEDYANRYCNINQFPIQDEKIIMLR